MNKYIVKRVFNAVITIWAIMTITFFLVRISGDPAELILGQESTPEAVQNLRNELGLNNPLFVQYTNYFKDILMGDFGMSYWQNKPN